MARQLLGSSSQNDVFLNRPVRSFPKQALTSEIHITHRGAHIEEELTTSTTLSTISRSDTMVIDPDGKTPSRDKERNLGTLPTSIVFSSPPPPRGTFFTAVRDLPSAVQTGEDGRQLDYDTRVESRQDLIAGTIVGHSEGLSNTPTERLSVNLLPNP